eukprot:Sspe_Gene.118893::Locus_113437_Transcript_1_1_Confidence_1.000_Length_806::g.118893::m.118893
MEKKGGKQMNEAAQGEALLKHHPLDPTVSIKELFQGVLWMLLFLAGRGKGGGGGLISPHDSFGLPTQVILIWCLSPSLQCAVPHFPEYFVSLLSEGWRALYTVVLVLR